MGGPGSGKKTDRAAALRAEGLSLPEIGRRLGCSNQAVHHLLRAAAGQSLAQPIRCRECRKDIAQPKQCMWMNRAPLCLECLARRPNASFPERLRAFRLARGMTQRELARALGIAVTSVVLYERPNRALLTLPVLRKMLRLFGPGLVRLEPPTDREGNS